MSATVWKWARLVGSAATVAVLVWRLGASPFLDGIRTVDARALAAASALAIDVRFRNVSAVTPLVTRANPPVGSAESEICKMIQGTGMAAQNSE